MFRALVGAILFAGVFIALQTVLEGDPIALSLRRLQGGRTPWEPGGGERKDRGLYPMARFLDRLLARRAFRPLASRLAQADLRLKSGEALLILGLTASLLTLLLIRTVGILGLPIACLLTLGLAFYGLNLLKRRRLARIEGALPDFLQAVANGVRAGHALVVSLEAAAGNETAPLAQEIQKTLGQVRIGISVEEALEDLAKRVELVEMELFVTAVLVQRQVGGNLAEVLDRIQTTLRERVRVANEVKALTAQGRLSGWVVGVLPVGLALLMAFLDPGFMAPLFRTALGRLMMGTAAGLELAGAVLISRIVRVDV